MGHQIDIGPADYSGSDINDLKEVVNPLITGSSAEMDYLSLSRDSHENVNAGKFSNIQREKNFKD